MSDKSNTVDYYNTIIRFIREMLKENRFYKKLTKVNFEALLTGFKTKRWTHGPKAFCHTLGNPYSSSKPRVYQAQKSAHSAHTIATHVECQKSPNFP